MLSNDRYWQAKKITLWGALKNILLGIIKLFGGLYCHSHALFADGVHSFSDLITDIMVLLASRFSSQDADETHPYGHQRIETAATFLLAMLLVLTGFAIAWDAITLIIKGSDITPNWLALPIALISIAANELLFHYTRFIGNKINSPLITANAWHHRSDAASSVIVALSLIASLLGVKYVDAIAAILVGLMIAKMGFEYGWNSIKELVDTAVDAKTFAIIEKTIQQVEGVEKVHQLRSRFMAGAILIDVHILVSPFISVSEGHYIAQHVHRALLSKVGGVRDVTVHVDPEDDETNCPSLHLPNRPTLEKKLIQQWKNKFPGITHSVIHYLDGQLIIDVFGKDWQKTPPGLVSDIKKSLETYPTIKHVRIMNCLEEV